MNDEMNLLPLAFRQRELRQARLIQWSVVWVTTLLLCGGGVGWKYSNGQWLRDRVRSLEEQCVPIRQLASHNQMLKAQLSEFNGRQSLLAELEHSQRPFQVLGIISQGTLLTDKRLHIEQLQLTQKEQRPPSPAPATPAGKPAAETVAATVQHQLVLTGYAADDLAVARFITHLRRSAVFNSVDLESSSRVIHPSGHAQRYEVRCTY